MERPISDVLDGNEAAARIAYALSEVVAIYPITPASTMGELADEWAAKGKANLWGAVPRVVEMQSEAGAAGALHGALIAGSLATTFTASQGLLLMIPDMYKIAGELTPFVMHVAARSVATHALSIFGDHSDVMAARQTGFAMLCSASVQEAMDLAVIAHVATIESRIPFLHFFDGFRTSHEIQKISVVGENVLRALLDAEGIASHRRRSLSPDHPTLRGSAQNPDVFFQAREAANKHYSGCPQAVRAAMDRFAELTGRRYGLVDYTGHPEAERVVVMMGSASSAAEEAALALNEAGERVGVLKVRLYRPFEPQDLLKALPRSTRSIAVLDRTKEPGSPGEPLYLDVVAALYQGGRTPVVIGGRYGLSSKEFTPAMARAVFSELAKPSPKPQFTVGIVDDVTGLSLAWSEEGQAEPKGVKSAVFFGLGSDGTVGANKNTVKLVARHTDLYAQAYFVYDSKKSGSLTVSHLRFSQQPIQSSYLIRGADFVACHQEGFLERYDVLSAAADGATLLLNMANPARAWDRLPREVQEIVIRKKLRVFAVDAYGLARQAGLGGRINTVMQTAFFEISGILPGYAPLVKESIVKSYGGRDASVVEKNLRAAEAAPKNIVEVAVPAQATSDRRLRPLVDADAPPFVKNVVAEMMAGRGDALPVSALPEDGSFPTGTARWEKRSISQEIPVWDEGLCIQCNKCALVCPHSAIRVKAYPESGRHPGSFKATPWRGREFSGPTQYTVQVSPQDCTGCELCVVVCPAKSRQEPARKALSMAALSPELKEAESLNFKHFLNLPEAQASAPAAESVKSSQLRQPLFEFSGACAGCGETPYLKLLTQLFGERLLIANATGCSSIFGGNLPTTPWTTNAEGRGPAWANSLFEDNAEFGLGLRLALDHQRDYARRLLGALKEDLDEALVQELLEADQKEPAAIRAQRRRVAALKSALSRGSHAQARELLSVADALARKSVWIVGGDGWAYDIGFGGLDHVLRSGANVKVLVLDTEVYSNTGGQASKATPRAAVARFAASGKASARKDLALLALTMNDVYVARIAMGANDTQTVKALAEAEAYDGPALVVAYAHCIAHGIEMCEGLNEQKLAVESGYWPLFRYDPGRQSGAARLTFDSGPAKRPLEDYVYREARYRRLRDSDPRQAAHLLDQAKADVQRQWELLQAFARA